MTSLLKISEQIISIAGKGSIQEIAEAVRNAYAYVAKKQWWENYAEGNNEVDGSGLYVFNNLSAQLDTDQGRYYVELPSRYLTLPHEMGISFVGYTDAQDQGFIRLPPGTLGLFSGLKSFGMGGRQAHTVEGGRIYFDKMTKATSVGPITLKLSIAVDTVEVDEELNIPSTMVNEIIDLVMSQYQYKKEKQPDTLT